MQNQHHPPCKQEVVFWLHSLQPGDTQDLNAETSARHALILQLLADSNAEPLSRRIWTIFALWRLAKTMGTVLRCFW